MVVVSPLAAFGAYFALGAVVLASRLLFPERPAVQGEASAIVAANEQTELAKAA
jgi:hypothetical protein